MKYTENLFVAQRQCLPIVFSGPKILFGSQIFLDPKFVWTQKFVDIHFLLQLDIYWTYKSFEQFFLDQPFFLEFVMLKI